MSKVTLDDLLGDDFDEYTLKYLLEDEKIAALVKQLSKPIHTFQPREDDLANYDEQSKFVTDVWDGIKICVAGNACIAGESLVFDPVAGGYRRVDSVSGDWWVRAWDEQNKCWVVARALKPFVKGVADLYRVRLSNGCELVCTDQHRVLASEFGFQRVCELSHSQSIGDISLVGFPLGVARSCRTVPDCRDDCLRDSHQCGERLLAGQDSGLASVPFRGGVLECSRCDCGLGDRLGLLQECSHSCLSSSHLSIDHSLRAEHLGHALENGCSELCSRRDSQVVLECLDLESQPFDRFGCRSDRPDKAGGLVRSVRGCTCDWDGSVALEDVRIVSIEFLRKDEFYDFTVPIYHNYELAGIVNHNSGKTEAAAYMVAKFLLETPASRDLCPFLVVSQNYDMCGAIYQEKLRRYLDGHVESVRWRNINRQFPAEIILKPNHVNGNRHVVQFASYEQGRQAFQAISASGWWCDEQCDMSLIQELFVRTRDHSNPLMIHTLTPLEPSYELEDLYKRRNEFKVAATYRFYRMNTMKNTALSAHWRKSFFDVVPDDMQATRQLGAFARFEGLIYKEFRDELHIIKPRHIPVDAIHYRSIDFGYRNMACLWGCFVKGAWWIYDELLIHDTLTEDFAQVILDKSEKWGWKPGELQFSTTYADWEDPAGMVRMRDRGVYCSPARKEVGAGIDCVRQKFIGIDKCPQLYIFDTCTELIRELKEYSWMAGPKNPINRVDSKEAPVKFHDHCCFPAGQLVNTPCGFVSIENLKVGDEVLSHLGISRVDACGKTGELPIVKVNFVDGRTILCSEDHPLATSDGGWIEAVNSLGMELDVCKLKLDEREVVISQSMSSMGGTGGIVTPSWAETPIIPTSVISVGMNDVMGGCVVSGYISKSGWMNVVLFQLGWLCIMLMGIKPIMRLKTWCLKRIQNIQRIMGICKLRLRRLRFGMGLRRVVSGMRNMRERCGMMFNRQSVCVNNVVESMRVGSSILSSSVATIVGPQQDEILGSIMSNECVGVVDQSLLPTSMERRSFARMNVENLMVGSVEKLAVSEVFNLATSDGTFFVNGVLVSNCDALRYLIYSRESAIVKAWAPVEKKEKKRSMFGR